MTEDKFGTIVNDREAKPEEASITLRITPQMFDRLAHASQFQNYPSVEDFCIVKLIEALNEKVGKATIDKPHQMSGAQAQKISGPSFSGLISRA